MIDEYCKQWGEIILQAWVMSQPVPLKEGGGVVGLGMWVGTRKSGGGGGRYLIPCLDFLNYVLLGKVGHTLQKMRE